jgi:hypothetical protein
VIDKKVLFEAVKEPLRLLALALIPFAIAYFAGLSYEWAGAITVVLRFVDSWLHELAKAEPKKEQNTGILGLRGLTGF